MSYVKSYRDLEVYKLSREVSKEIFIISKKFPFEEKYSLTDQIRRSSRSVGAQIAEAWGKRRYELHFISKLTDADSEQLETQHWIEISEECNYINTEKAKNTLQKCESIGKMIQSMIDKSSIFCNNKSKERTMNNEVISNQ
jgi:four helix bundle protein